MRRCLVSLIALMIFSATPGEAAQNAGHRARRGQPTVTWLFQPVNRRDETPGVRVFLVVGGRRVFIIERAGGFFLMERQRYEDFDVPPTAITACFGNQAGAGTNIYVIRRGRRLIVYMQDWDAEEAERERYRQIRVIPLPR